MMPPLRGDLAPTQFREPPGTGVPVMGPSAKMRMLSGESGSMPGFNSFRR